MHPLVSIITLEVFQPSGRKKLAELSFQGQTPYLHHKLTCTLLGQAELVGVCFCNPVQTSLLQCTSGACCGIVPSLSCLWGAGHSNGPLVSGSSQRAVFPEDSAPPETHHPFR